VGKLKMRTEKAGRYVNLVWEEFLKIIKEEAGSQVVETWFKAASLDLWDQESNVAHLLMPNQFVGTWIEEHYTSLIKTHLGRLLHSSDIKLNFIYKKNEAHTPQKTTHDLELTTPSNQANFQAPALDLTKKKKIYFNRAAELYKNSPSFSVAPAKQARSLFKPQLNPQYTFESFVVGPTNSLAHAAAIAVSQSLGCVYNPLFIYGSTGLGKTHLLHAIANEVRMAMPDANILYETADTFMNEFINSIRQDKSRQFREKYVNTSLLLLDDIQFLSNKEQTQEAFFNIFDALHSRNKQVVFSSDTLPQNITGLQDRLKSRLQSGLIADVHLPTLEMKMVIINKKAEVHNIKLQEDVARFIAEQSVTSIRELEGCLIRLAAVSSISGQSVSLELAKRALSNFVEVEEKAVSLDSVAKVVARYCAVSISDLKSEKRNKQFSTPRQIAFYAMKKYTKSSLQTIGEFMGGRDHSTVLHAVTKIEGLISKDLELRAKIEAIEQTLHRR
jgi:chromosomal replication initiator protein